MQQEEARTAPAMPPAANQPFRLSGRREAIGAAVRLVITFIANRLEFTKRAYKVCSNYRLKEVFFRMANNLAGLKRAELARQTGCNLETILYYEKTGMMPDPPRTAAGYRVYGPAHVSRLRFILRARELGFSIEEIRGLLGLVDRGTQTCAEVQMRTEIHLADVRAKIRDLKRIERILAETASRCSGDAVPDCPVLDALAS